MKRHYFRNQEIHHAGYYISITSAGTTYHNNGGTFRRLASIWMQRTQTLVVSLPNDEELHLRLGKKGFEVVEKEEVL